MIDKACIHNQRLRYMNGFLCEDCNEFFTNDSPTYRSGELLSTLWMILHNINVHLIRSGKEADFVVTEMKEEIGICEEHENYEDIISRSELIIAKHGKNLESATVVLR